LKRNRARIVGFERVNKCQTHFDEERHGLAEVAPDWPLSVRILRFVCESQNAFFAILRLCFESQTRSIRFCDSGSKRKIYPSDFANRFTTAPCLQRHFAMHSRDAMRGRSGKRCESQSGIVLLLSFCAWVYYSRVLMLHVVDAVEDREVFISLFCHWVSNRMM
jgi:hypothetical protein